MRIFTAGLLVVILFLDGCISAVTKIKGDDDVVARSVQAEKVLFNSANTLFIIERQQQAQLAVPFKDLHQYAQNERTEVPRLLMTLRTYTMIYRETTISPKPDIAPVIERAEALGIELRSWLSKVATSHIPPPPLPAVHAAGLPTGNPYVDAAAQLITLIQTGLTMYQAAQAKAVANGVLIDADENLLHLREDTAMASASWQVQ